MKTTLPTIRITTAFLALCLMSLALATDASATTYYSAYGTSRSQSITVAAGSHNFQVDAIAANKNTEWYVNGAYTGAGQNDWSGNPIWPLNPTDPEYTRSFSAGTTTEIKALVYDNNWVYQQYHIWNVTVPAPDTTPPTVPSLSSPANGAITTDTTVALDWSDSTDASGINNYEVQVDDSSAFGSPNWTSLPTSSSATTAALADGLYYWRVRAKDNASTPNWSAWSSSRSIRVDTTAPSVPTLVSPSNGSSTGDQTPTFDWSDSSDGGSGVDHYEVDIYDGDLTWGDINTTVTTSTYTPGSNIPFDTIYWRIRAYDRAGNVSAWSTVWSVIIADTVAPTVPTLSSPADIAITSDNTVALDWSDASDSGTGVGGYEVQVDDSNMFGSPNWTGTPGSSSDTTAALADGLYYWRVRARDNANNYSSWSSSRSIRVDTTAPSVPTLVSPSNGGSTGDQTPTFDWNDSTDTGSGVDHYEVDIYDGDLTWGDLNTTVTTSTFTPGSNIPLDTIYWRIRAYDRAGNVSAWSTVWSVIIVDNVAPTVPTLSSPTDAAITSDNTVALDWADSTDSGTGVSGYEIQVDDSAAFASPNWTSLPTSSSATTAALADGLYYWRVRARDNANNYSSWSSSRSIRVDTTAPSVPTLVSPSNGGSTGDQTPTFDWNDSTDTGSGVDHYEVDIYDGDLTWGDLNTTVTTSTFTPGSNIPLDTIYWRIRAYDRAGNVSAWSTEWSVIIAQRIVSAYWWMPLDVSDGDTVTMCAEVEGIPVGAQCTFQVYEDDGGWPLDDTVGSPVTGIVYTAEGKTYVKATWSAAWQDDQWGDSEHYFKITYGGLSLYSSRDQDNELIVRNDRQQPSSSHGDFYYSTGEATSQAALTDDRIPVILVHGASGDRKIDSLNYWYGWVNGDMSLAGAQLGRFNTADMRSRFRVYRYVYDSRRSIADNGQDFAAFLNQFFASHPEFAERQVVIMAHSMGGLVSRYALNTDAAFRTKIHRLITLGTPHLGSPLANPSWVRQESPSETATEAVLSVLYYSNFGGTQGDFDLAWHSTSEIPVSARPGGAYYNWTVNMGYFNQGLLDSSLSSPFAGSANMSSTTGDGKITAYGGHFTTLINGQGPSWPEEAADEVTTFGLTDHSGLHTLRNALWDMNFDNGSTVANNDGMVPLTSALLGTGHTDVEKINLTQANGEALDHSSYLDVPSTMDYVAQRLLTIVKVTISPQAVVEAGARWRITGGSWQKSAVSLNALPPGQYTIEFKDIAGWTKPVNQTVTVAQNATAHLSGGGATYTQVANLPTITTSCPLSNGTTGNFYSQALAATGGTTPYAWTISSGALPPGLGLNSGTGLINGTPSTANTYNFTIRCTGANSQYADKACSLMISPVPAPTITTSCPLLNGTVGEPYSQPLDATGGTTPYTWIISSGALPPGLSIVGASVTGTPTAAGPFSFTLRCSGANGQSSDKPCNLTVNVLPAPSITTLCPLPVGMVGSNYDLELTAAGGTTPYTWSITAGTLPSGLSLTPSSGAISGTPTVANTYNFTIRCTSANSLYSDKSCSLTINPATPVLTNSPSGVTNAITQGQNATNQAFTIWNAGGGMLNYTNTVNQSWLSVSPTNGTSTGEQNPIQVSYMTAGLPTGTNFATITIKSQVATNTIPVTLIVTPITNRIIGLSGNLAFGNVATNTTAQRTLTITNGGNSPLNVTGIGYPTGFSGPWVGSIPSLGSTNVTVTFAPTALTSYAGTVTVSSDATSGASTTAISGSGVEPFSSLVVTTSSDSGAGSLRSALLTANLLGGGDITFSNVTGTITLQSPLPDIAANINILGPGADLLAVSGNSVTRVFRILPGTISTISRLTIRDGSALGQNGNGILNEGELRVLDCRITGNHVSAVAGGSGGGIASMGGLVLSNVLIWGNSCYSAGGGLYATGNVVIATCNISSNHAVNSASGLSFSTGRMVMTDSSIIGNGTPGASLAFGGLAIWSGTVYLTNTTVSFNQASAFNPNAGGIFNHGELVMENCTVSGNTSLPTGGIRNEGLLLSINSTISENESPVSVGGVHNLGSFEARNTIIAGNRGIATSTGGAVDFAGTLTSQGHNLIGNLSNTIVIGDITGNLNGVDPMLGPLQNNGGATWTHALFPGSPAIDAGTVVGAPAQDQRGVSRPRGAAVDIGAYEFKPMLPLVVLNTLDAGAGSLRQAMLEANAYGGGVITFSNVVGTITLVSPLPDMAENINILGPGAEILAVSGNGSRRVFRILPGAESLISGLTVRDGLAESADGDGILNEGNLTILNSRIIANGYYYGLGGGIASFGNLSISNVFVAENSKRVGGGIFASGSLNIVSSCISNNYATDYAGGIYFGNGSFTLRNSSLLRNRGGEAGGMIMLGAGHMTGATFAGNVCNGYGGPGGLHNYGDLALTNCTLSANDGDNAAGAIQNNGVMAIVSCTIVSNSAAWNYQSGGVVNVGALVAANTVFAETYNWQGSRLPDFQGTLTSLGHNLIANPSNAIISGDITGNLYWVDPMLGPILDNGGPTWTHALLPGSPAIDAGTMSGAPATDQRGMPRLQGIAPDIGAFESHFALPSMVKVTRQANGSGVIQWLGHPALTHTLQASSNLVNWVDLAAISRHPGALYNVTNQDFQNHPQRFYRVMTAGRLTPVAYLTAKLGRITAPYIVTNDYVYHATNAATIAIGGLAEYDFTLNASGNYVFQFLTDAPNGGLNSFFWNVDAQPTTDAMIWDIPLTIGFEQRIGAWRGAGTFDNNLIVPKSFALAAGNHTLYVRGREGGSAFQTIVIMKLE